MSTDLFSWAVQIEQLAKSAFLYSSRSSASYQTCWDPECPSSSLSRSFGSVFDLGGVASYFSLSQTCSILFDSGPFCLGPCLLSNAISAHFLLSDPSKLVQLDMYPFRLVLDLITSNIINGSCASSFSQMLTLLLLRGWETFGLEIWPNDYLSFLKRLACQCIQAGPFTRIWFHFPLFVASLLASPILYWCCSTGYYCYQQEAGSLSILLDLCHQGC